MFKIGNTVVAEPAKEGLSITREPIWASNTGRGSDGKMVGDVVDWKATVTVKWPPLSYAEIQRIINAIVGNGHVPFFSITYTVNIDYSGSRPVETVETKTVYCGNIPQTIYSLTKAAQYHTGVEITFIEQ